MPGNRRLVFYPMAFRGFNRIMGLRFGTIDIEWVYNSMPLAHGQIYPEVALKPIVDFN